MTNSDATFKVVKLFEGIFAILYQTYSFRRY